MLRVGIFIVHTYIISTRVNNFLNKSTSRHVTDFSSLICERGAETGLKRICL